MHHPGQKSERAIAERLHDTDQIFLEGDSLSYPIFFTESIKTAGRKSLAFNFPPCFSGPLQSPVKSFCLRILPDNLAILNLMYFWT